MKDPADIERALCVAFIRQLADDAPATADMQTMARGLYMVADELESLGHHNGASAWRATCDSIKKERGRNNRNEGEGSK